MHDAVADRQIEDVKDGSDILIEVLSDLLATQPARVTSSSGGRRRAPNAQGCRHVSDW
jgi:hypothetical protein